jgi:hypothetical protein
MVAMLTAGRSVLLVRSYGNEMKLASYLSGSDPLVVDEEGQGRNVWGLHRFQYVGERGDDGWITAPPGGWGSNPVPGRRIEVRFKDGETRVGPSGAHSDARWCHDPRIFLRLHIIAFRLVEEASPQDQGSSAIEADTHRAAEGAVVAPPSPGGWLVKDFADGWYWTGDRLNADMAANGGACVYSVESGEYETRHPLELIAAARAKEAGE